MQFIFICTRLENDGRKTHQIAIWNEDTCEYPEVTACSWDVLLVLIIC